MKTAAAFMQICLKAFARTKVRSPPHDSSDTRLPARAQEKMPAADAIAQIKAAARAGRRVLGVDGFKVVPEGHLASLDLILDLSTRPMTHAAAAETAIEFIAARSADDMLFEVVIEGAGVA